MILFDSLAPCVRVFALVDFFCAFPSKCFLLFVVSFFILFHFCGVLFVSSSGLFCILLACLLLVCLVLSVLSWCCCYVLCNVSFWFCVSVAFALWFLFISFCCWFDLIFFFRAIDISFLGFVFDILH